MNFDASVDAALAPLRRNRWVNRVMYSLTELGDFSLIWHVISLSHGAFGGRRGEREMLRLSSTLAVEALLVNGPIKSAFRRERPIIELERPHTLRTPRTSSFPSGHASAAACAVTLLVDGAGPAERVAWSTLGLLVALSRVHVQIHHASDVVGGAVVGVAIGSFARRVWPLR